MNQIKSQTVPTFKSLISAYTQMMQKKYLLEKPNGLLYQAFSEWNESDFKQVFKNNTLDMNNVLLMQEQDENNLKGTPYSLRFYNPYYNQTVGNVVRGNIPDFLKTKIDLKIEIPKDLNDSEKMENAEKQYASLSAKDKREEFAKILKSFAIVCARVANVHNRFKDSSSKDYSQTMTSKDVNIESFMLIAIKYNSLVPEEKQIPFGINDSKQGPVIEASLPGYTRLSLHFGSIEKCAKMLADVNRLLQSSGMEPYFPDYKINDVDNSYKKKYAYNYINNIYKQFGYNFDKFHVINTGLINNMDYENSDIYQMQMRAKEQNPDDTMDYKRIEIYSNFMYPDLNDREMFYLAEKAGFGKADLEKLQSKLEVRSGRMARAEKNGTNLRSQYISESVNKAPGQRKKIKVIEELYSAYKETSEIYKDLDTSLDAFEVLLEESGISNDIINDFLDKALEEEVPIIPPTPTESGHSETYNQMNESVKQQGPNNRAQVEATDNTIQNQNNKKDNPNIGESGSDDGNR